MKDYYQILGVKRNATLSEIKKAYRELAKKYHPDAMGDQEDLKRKFQEITEAYQVLSNEESRKKYHAWGHAAYTEQARRSASSGEENTEDGHCGACQNRNPRPKEEGPPPYSIRTAVHMSFQEVITGARKTAEIILKEPCTHCSGERVSLEDRSRKCPFCHGKGYVEKKRQVQVNIPARTYDGCFYHLEDVLCPEEEPVMQKNIVVVVLVDDQAGYIRQDYHLYATKMVGYSEMVLGGEIEIPTIEGTEKYIIGPGTLNGTRIRLAGRGLWMPPKVGNRGDLYVTLQVEIPRELTDVQREALQAFRKTLQTAE